MKKAHSLVMKVTDLIDEELLPHQKKQVDGWEKGDTSFSDKAMGHKDRVSVPLEEHSHLEAHPEIKSHLESNGYKIDDYRKGSATDKYGRSTKIGKALVKTGADKDLLHKFNTDPRRQSSNSSGLHVVISRHPHDVAGMSTNKGWSSCMNMKEGSNRHYLPHEIKAGTHVAYLAHKDDKDLKNPVARIALKTFKNEKGEHILRPEQSTYGNGGTQFDHTVRKWTEDHFPAHPDSLYHKHEDSYDDDGKTLAYSNDEKTSDAVLKSHPHHAEDIAGSGKLTDETMKHLFEDHPMAIMKNPQLKPHQIHHLIDTEPQHHDEIAGNKSLNSDHIDKIISGTSSGSRYGRLALTSHRNLTPSHFEKLSNDPASMTRQSLAHHPNLPKSVKHKLIDDKENSVSAAVAQRPHLTDDDFEKLHSKKSYDVNSALSINTKLAPKHYDKLVENRDNHYLLSGNEAIKPHHIDHILKHSDVESVHDSLATNSNTTHSHIDHLLNSAEDRGRLGKKDMMHAIAKKTNLSDDHVHRLANYYEDEGRNDQNYEDGSKSKQSFITNPHLTDKQHDIIRQYNHLGPLMYNHLKGKSEE